MKDVMMIRNVRDYVFSKGDSSGTIYGYIILGFAQEGLMGEGIQVLKKIHEQRISTGGHPYTILLKLAGSLASLYHGDTIYKMYLKSGLKDSVVDTAAIEMFGRCGEPDIAKTIFESLRLKDLICWTTYLQCLTLNGRSKEAIDVFHNIQQVGYAPNHLTVTVALQACSHGGFVDVAKVIWKKFSYLKDEIMVNCMVDVLARSGLLEEAESLLRKETKNIRESTALKAILGACRTHSDLNRALRIGYELIEINPTDASNYIVLANLCEACGNKKEQTKIQNLKRANKAWKIPGISQIEINGEPHSFVASDSSHPQILEIKKKLGEVAKNLILHGYIFDLKWCTSQTALSEEDKINALCEHSEKLAICLGLLNTPHGVTLRITKNLRMCGDCHSATKYIARLYKRDILVRDKSRFHHFTQDGKCSCNDFY
uniref:DYW domain-containing protein n=1 Tax=Arcella intermedia TaxID=1963864 RepID=A0A6B2L4M4_9EUKA